MLINDHDPVPLHGQMEAMRPWEYIVRGPEIFRIRVSPIARLCGSETSPSSVPQVLWESSQGLRELQRSMSLCFHSCTDG